MVRLSYDCYNNDDRTWSQRERAVLLVTLSNQRTDSEILKKIRKSLPNSAISYDMIEGKGHEVFTYDSVKKDYPEVDTVVVFRMNGTKREFLTLMNFGDEERNRRNTAVAGDLRRIFQKATGTNFDKYRTLSDEEWAVIEKCHEEELKKLLEQRDNIDKSNNKTSREGMLHLPEYRVSLWARPNYDSEVHSLVDTFHAVEPVCGFLRGRGGDVNSDPGTFFFAITDWPG